MCRAQAFLSDSVAVSREVGDRWAAAASGQEEQAAAALEESLALARAEGEPRLIANALFHDLLRGVYSAAIERADERARTWAAGVECLQLYQAIGDRVDIARVQ